MTADDFLAFVDEDSQDLQVAAYCGNLHLTTVRTYGRFRRLLHRCMVRKTVVWGDAGRRTKTAPLHAGAHDAQDVVVRVVKRQQRGSAPPAVREGFPDRDPQDASVHALDTVR